MSETVEAASIDPDEVERFARIADEWWDPKGKFRPLHALNPARLRYIQQTIARHFHRNAASLKVADGLSALDIGCGGGLVAEPLARMGASVTGIDATPVNIDVARAHAEQMRLPIDYRAVAAEDLAEEGRTYDIVTSLEVIEHVADVSGFLETCRKLVRPGGLFIGSTLNRTPQSFLTAIVGAEYLLGWLPRGTHDWRKFLSPDEFDDALNAAGLSVRDVQGLNFDPISGDWSLGGSEAINYLLCAVRPEGG